MNRKLFSDKMTGELVLADAPDPDWAFVPAPLPPRAWRFPQRLWPLLSDAKERLGTLNGIGRTLPNPELLLRPLQSREALRSSSLEGTYATPEELLLFEKSADKEPTSEGDRRNAWLEVFNYGESLRLGMELLGSLPFSLRLVRAIHERLLRGVRGRERTPGDIRRTQVCIGSDRRFVPPPIDRLPDTLSELEKYMNTEDSEPDGLVRCYLLHYQFEAIHPFLDGNGRVGRALLSLMIYKLCGHHMPWLYMSAFFERFKDEYVDKLFKVSAEGAWDDWLEFCLRGTIEQANDSIRRCEELRELRDKYAARLDRGSVRTHQIVERLFTDPIVTAPEIEKALNVSYPTARRDLDLLVQAGILRLIERTHPMAFCAHEVFAIAYREPHDADEIPRDEPREGV